MHVVVGPRRQLASVDFVINVGAPKGCSRLLQRIGRSNHRLDEPSEAVLVPANRFEVLLVHTIDDTHSADTTANI